MRDFLLPEQPALEFFSNFCSTPGSQGLKTGQYDTTINQLAKKASS
jgi:hypothetical protein